MLGAFFLWSMNSIVSVTSCVFHPCDRCTSSLQIYFVHTGLSIYNRSLYPKHFPEVSHWMWCAVGSTTIASFLGSMQTWYSDSLGRLFFLLAPWGKI